MAMEPAAQPEQTALMQNVQWLMSQGIPMDRALEMARGGTTVNVGGEGQPTPQLLGTSGLVAIPDPSVPQGYRVEPAPGSPLAEERAAAEQKTAERERQTSIRMGTTLENLNLNIQEIENGGLPVTGMAGAVGRMFPGSAAADFANRTAQINTRAALDEVQSMRDNSPTGGAVGQLTDSEREAIGMAATSMNDASSAPEYMRTAKRFREVMLDVAYGAGKWSIDANGQVQVKTTLPTAPVGGAPVVIDGVTIRKVN
jgi:hypothetical protein